MENLDPIEAGASAAAKAYHEQLASDLRDVAMPGAAVQTGNRPAGVDARAAVRKLVSGRAGVLVQGGGPQALQGKMIDLSLTGACVLMADTLPSKRICTLTVDIFQEGKPYRFTVQAVSVYGVLVSGRGFKVGFQFGPCSQHAMTTIAALVGK